MGRGAETDQVDAISDIGALGVGSRLSAGVAAGNIRAVGDQHDAAIALVGREFLTRQFERLGDRRLPNGVDLGKFLFQLLPGRSIQRISFRRTCALPARIAVHAARLRTQVSRISAGSLSISSPADFRAV